jgi:ABC-type transporter Mla MlaB component
VQAVAVPARIDAENAVDVLASLSPAAADAAPLVLDLAPLQEFDSSALSLLLELGRERLASARRAGTGQSAPAQQEGAAARPVPLVLLNPPKKLRELAELYGVAELLFGASAKSSPQAMPATA